MLENNKPLENIEDILISQKLRLCGLGRHIKKILGREPNLVGDRVSFSAMWSEHCS